MIASSLPSSTFSDRSNVAPVIPFKTMSKAGMLADRIGFILLLLAVAALIIRPADLFPSLGALHFYEVILLTCIVVASPQLADQLKIQSLRQNSIAVLGLLLIPASMLAYLIHLDAYDAQAAGIHLIKNCLAFLLLIRLTSSPRRLIAILWVVTACILIEGCLAFLQYRGLLHLHALQSIVQTSYDSVTDKPSALVRVCGIGVFNDPNDFALILVVAMVVCAFGLEERWMGWARILLVFPLLLLGYVLTLTHSRGGLLAALAAVVAFLPARIGWRNTAPLAFVLGPVLLLTLTGREAHVDLDNPDDTFETRLMLWSSSFDAFRSAPLFGIGQGRLVDEIGQVSHNSYLHAYAEMGLFGGTAFLGLFYLTLRGLKSTQPADPSLRRLRPYMLALVASYAVGILSLSRCYTVPTLLIVALGASYIALAERGTGRSSLRFDGACIGRVFTVGVLLLIVLYVFLRIMLSGRAA